MKQLRRKWLLSVIECQIKYFFYRERTITKKNWQKRRKEMLGKYLDLGSTFSSIVLERKGTITKIWKNWKSEVEWMIQKMHYWKYRQYYERFRNVEGICHFIPITMHLLLRKWMCSAEYVKTDVKSSIAKREMIKNMYVHKCSRIASSWKIN